MMRTFSLLCILLIFAHCRRYDTGLPVAAAAASASVEPRQPAQPAAAPVKNIIFVVGDGMALAQVTAGIYWRGGLEKSVFSRFPYVGFHKSFSADDLVTDSAAGATAFACGQKTNNGEIGMLPNKKPCRTILEDWAAAGYGTGIVVTCTATHATPASFIGHQVMRGFTEQIAEDYLKTPLDCFIGGGEHYFSAKYPDQQSLQEQLRKRGYLIRTGTNFKRIPMDGSRPFMQFTDDREPPTASAGRRYLPEAAKAACKFLKARKPQGFFMLIEGSQIDWALHANDRRWLMAEMTDFDKMLQNVLDFAQKDGETLVVVTGDHECGGFSMPESLSKKDIKSTFATRLHTGTLVPVFAFGPQAEQFQGIYDNTAIYAKMKAIGGK